MTINSTTRKAGPYSGNDATTVFPFSFRVFGKADMLVIRADATGAETPLAVDADYTLSLNANQSTNPGGTVTLPAALVSGTTLTITSAIPNLQPTDITNNGGFFPKVLNDTFDRIVIQIQQLADAVGRSLKTSVSTPDGVDPTLPTPVPYQVIGWNATGTGLQNTDPTYSTLLATDLASGTAGKGARMVAYVLRLAGSVWRSVEAKLSDTISVKDFGAVGDGVTDDTAALQAALTAAAGRRLFAPGGTYIASPLVIYSGTTLVGEGPGATIIKAKSTLPGNAALLRNNTQSGAPGVYSDQKIRLEGITFDGAGLGGRTAELVSFGKVRSLSAINCHVQNVGYMGLAVGGCAFPKIISCEFSGTGNPVVTAEGGAALWFGTAGDGTHSTDPLVIGCTFRNLEWAGIYANADRAKIIGNDFESVKEAAIFSGPVIGMTIVGNTINGVARKNISASGIETGASHVVITGNYIANTANCHIALTDTQTVTISGNTLRECRQEPAYYPTASSIGIVTDTTAPNQPQSITISGNTFGSFANQPYAFVAVGGTGAAVTGLVVQNNNCSGNGYTSGRGINFQAGKRGAGCVTRGNPGTETAEPKVGEFQTAAAPGVQSITGLGFRPSRIELHAIVSSGTAILESDSIIDASGASVCHSMSAGSGAAYGTTFGSQALHIISPAGVNQVVATFTSFDDDGFTLTLTTTTVQAWARYVAHP